jgi:hypothetical protein
MRFNPPPNWPVAPDWTPEPGWTPDPAWPSAPPGWQFWIDDSAPPAVVVPQTATQQAYHVTPQWQPTDPWQPTGPVSLGPPPNRRNRNLFIWLGVGALLVIALVVGLVFAFGSGEKPKSDSDEDQIRAVVSSLESAWNRSDYGGFIGHTCIKVHEALTKSGFNDWRNQGGEVKFKINSIKADGDSAQVQVSETFSKQGELDEKLDFKKESGEWKMCGGVKT